MALDEDLRQPIPVEKLKADNWIFSLLIQTPMKQIECDIDPHKCMYIIATIVPFDGQQDR